MSKTRTSPLSTVANFRFDDFGNEGVLALVAANGEWAWVEPVVYAEYAMSSVCVTLQLSENSDGEIPDAVSEIVDALFTREFDIKFSKELTAEGAFDAAIEAALAEAAVFYNRFNAGDYTPFNDVTPPIRRGTRRSGLMTGPTASPPWTPPAPKRMKRMKGLASNTRTRWSPSTTLPSRGPRPPTSGAPLTP